MKTTYIYAVLIVALVVGLIVIRNASDTSSNATQTKYDVFAQCLADAGAKFYGAYWCPHCQAQKKLFENSKLLPYIECSAPSGQAQTQICIDKNITSYPTWEFTDGTRLDGEQTFEALGAKTSCAVPTT
jgi:hypothetical protein